jgi:hypothetical protein
MLELILCGYVCEFSGVFSAMSNPGYNDGLFLSALGGHRANPELGQVMVLIRNQRLTLKSVYATIVLREYSDNYYLIK